MKTARRDYVTIRVPVESELVYWQTALISDGKGGRRSLARKIQAGLDADNQLITIDRDAFRRVVAYGLLHNGGFQSHLRRLAVFWLFDNFNEAV